MQSWNLRELDAPAGTRDPVVLATEDGARAVMLKLEPGQELREHEVKERAWVAVVEGAARIGCNGSTFDGEPGTLVTFEPGERHSISTDGGARILLLLAPWPGEGHYQPDELGEPR
jgi:quercetin dioxygenase-like cupin family protein